MIGGLFGRKVAVELGVPGTPCIRLDDLRVSFKVSHKASKTASTATIQIYNPSQTSQAALRIPGAAIRLFVGYGDATRLVFWGTPVKGGIDLKVDGPDRVFVVDAADGGAGYDAFLNVSFATATTFGQVLALILAQTQWARGTITFPEATPLPHGIVLFGKAADVMDRLAASVPPPGADWFVRDSALYVIPRGTSTPEVAPLISATQGNLIGSPVSTKSGVKVRALIDATLRPGRRIVLQSASINGIYVCKDVTFTGDSGYSSEFYVDIAAVAEGTP